MDSPSSTLEYPFQCFALIPFLTNDISHITQPTDLQVLIVQGKNIAAFDTRKASIKQAIDYGAIASRKALPSQ